MIKDFKNQTAVITGGAAGIGLAIAERLAAEGANLVLADIETDVLDQAVAALEASGVDVLGVRTDVTVDDDLRVLAAATADRFGDVHLLVNNAGVVTTGRVEDQSDAQWDWVMNVNLRAVVQGCRIFLPAMKAHGQPAHIVNTASMAGLITGPYMAPYNVTKYGVVALSEALWHEGNNEGSNVGVSVLCPGFVQTGIDRSDRNGPAGVNGWVTEGDASAAWASILIEGVADGGPASDVADLVVKAVQTDELWVLPHAGTQAAASDRATQIVEATDRLHSDLG